MNFYSITLLKATSSGHRVLSTSGMHTAAEAVKKVWPMLSEDTGGISAETIESQVVTAIWYEDNKIALITRFDR